MRSGFRAAKRRAILYAAAGCFARDGFEKTSTADICRAAGISSGSLFHYFPSKRAVFVGIFEADNADNEELLATAVEMADPWEGVLAVVERMTSVIMLPGVVRLILEAARAVPGRRGQLGRRPAFAREP